MQQPADQAKQARGWRLAQSGQWVELMDVFTNAGQAIIAIDGNRLWLVLDDLDQLLGRWCSALRVAQSPVSVEGAMSAAGARR